MTYYTVLPGYITDSSKSTRLKGTYLFLINCTHFKASSCTPWPNNSVFRTKGLNPIPPSVPSLKISATDLPSTMNPYSAHIFSCLLSRLPSFPTWNTVKVYLSSPYYSCSFQSIIHTEAVMILKLQIWYYCLFKSWLYYFFGSSPDTS